METRSSKRKKILNASTKRPKISSLSNDHDEEDRISDLPDEILHQILILLPIKSIAKTSILSKRWKNLWNSFPDLDFTTVNTIANSSIAMTSKNVRKKERFYVLKGSEYVDQILTLIDKHSDIRVLKFRAFLSFSRLNHLVRNAVKHNVQELDIEVSTSDYFNFPRSVITSRSLRVLRLKSWHPGFRLPPLETMRDGFKLLSSLSLSRVILHDQPSLIDLFTNSSFPLLKKLHLEALFGLKQLRITCPFLEDLSLESCFQLLELEICVGRLRKLKVLSCFDAYSVRSRVKIDAPNLEILLWSYNAVTEESVLKNLHLLNEAFVGFFLLHEDLSVVKSQSVSNFLSGISNCRSLTLDRQCIEILSKNNKFAGVSLCPFNKLKSLEFSTGFNKHNNSGLAKCNNIIQWNKELWELPNSGEEKYWESQIQNLRSFLHHLKVVKIHGFTECANDVTLVKFLLKHAKVLQELFLFTCSLSKSRESLLREKIKSQIMGFSRASSKAKIVFE
ncbi:hypothetical protein ACJIZ3_010809 [Penstemon smallii]|uniref:F-box domain-containing protein n=1 Tax=Penstemon smallii TaxID=265156 RepID=A0ABD3UHH0_9LAMI